ncbi:MAG: hypothetical protein KF880_09440 [Ferruginibacter sp.]|nr:hypothetical protein [Ferruginibacter sp.]
MKNNYLDEMNTITGMTQEFIVKLIADLERKNQLIAQQQEDLDATKKCLAKQEQIVAEWKCLQDERETLMDKKNKEIIELTKKLHEKENEIYEIKYGNCDLLEDLSIVDDEFDPHNEATYPVEDKNQLIFSNRLGKMQVASLPFPDNDEVIEETLEEALQEEPIDSNIEDLSDEELGEKIDNCNQQITLYERAILKNPKEIHNPISIDIKLFELYKKWKQDYNRVLTDRQLEKLKKMKPKEELKKMKPKEKLKKKQPKPNYKNHALIKKVVLNTEEKSWQLPDDLYQ